MNFHKYLSFSLILILGVSSSCGKLLSFTGGDGNDTKIGTDDSIDENPPSHASECEGFEFNPFEHGNIDLVFEEEVSCYVPVTEFSYPYKSPPYPHPAGIPAMNEDNQNEVGTGVVCNYLMELPGEVLSTEAANHLPWYSGPFIDANGDFTLRYNACLEPCVVSDEEFSETHEDHGNVFCHSHLIRHGIDPDGNGYNNGYLFEGYDADEVLENSSVSSLCVTPSGYLLGEGELSNIPLFMNAKSLELFAELILSAFNFTIPQVLLEAIEEVPWTWNNWEQMGGCEYKALLVHNLGNEWLWDLACPDQYIPRLSTEMVYFEDNIYVTQKTGYCEMDGWKPNLPITPEYDWNESAWEDSDLLLEYLDWVKNDSVFLHPRLFENFEEKQELLLNLWNQGMVFQEEGGNPDFPLAYLEVPNLEWIPGTDDMGFIQDIFGLSSGDRILGISTGYPTNLEFRPGDPMTIEDWFMLKEHLMLGKRVSISYLSQKGTGSNYSPFITHIGLWANPSQ